MSRVVMIAEVEDTKAWVERFRSHREMFAEQYGTMGMNVIHFTTSDGNKVVLSADPPDVDAYFASLDSEETKAAMAEDGVKRETVEVYVLDQELLF